MDSLEKEMPDSDGLFWVVIIGFLLLVTFGCKTVEKTKSKTSSESLQVTESETLILQEIDVVTEVRKTLDMHMESIRIGRTIIYPSDDIFHYNENDGFKGKADSIVIHSRERKKETANESDSSKITASEKILDINKTKDLKADKEDAEDLDVSKKQSITPWIGAALGIALLTILLIIIFRAKRAVL